jgi:Tfp pilus assembly protein PilE
MPRLSTHRIRGFTRVELVVVLVVVVVLLSMLLPANYKVKAKSQRIDCVNNLKEIGTGERIWAGDHGDLAPERTVKISGDQAALFARTNAGPYCWAYYATLAGDLGVSPKIFICPSDERRSAAYFTRGGKTNEAGSGVFKDNNAVSYFVGAEANDIYPQSIAGGDRNLGPGTVPDPEYGYSPTNGQGNDVVINGAVCWSLKMHSAGNLAGAGNIRLGDGSAQQASSGAFSKTWLTNALTASSNHFGIRLVFP